MNLRVCGTVLALVLLMAPSPVQGQVRDAECATLMTRLGQAGDSCFEVAIWIVDTVSAPLILATGRRAFERHVSPRDVQPRVGQVPAMGGSVAGSEAIASIRPVAAAAASLAAVGSDYGASTVAALAVNPAVFLGGIDAPGSAARDARLSDVTVFVPVDGLDRDEDGKVDYFGVRLRLNAFTAGLGRDLAAEAIQAFGALVQAQVALADEIEPVLEAAPDLDGCVALLMAGTTGGAAVRAACGAELNVELDPGAVESVRRELERLRNEIDAGYFGVEVRLDFGDPTFGEVAGARGTRIFGGLGYGKRFVTDNVLDRSVGLRARLGVRYVTLDEAGPENGRTSDYQLEAGFGFEAIHPTGFEPIRLEVGLDARLGTPPEDHPSEAFESDAVALRGSLSIPLTESNAVTLTFGWPLSGDVTPVLAVSTSFGVLLSDQVGR